MFGGRLSDTGASEGWDGHTCQNGGATCYLLCALPSGSALTGLRGPESLSDFTPMRQYRWLMEFRN